MNNSKASSFDPLDYYKKLTRALATKRNLKVNMQNIPGGIQKKYSKPLITQQSLNAKFFAKYNNKQPEGQKINDGQEKQNLDVTSSNLLKRPLANPFKKPVAPKRKKKVESWINLSESYCRGIDIDFLLRDPPKKTSATKLSISWPLKSKPVKSGTQPSLNFKGTQLNTLPDRLVSSNVTQDKTELEQLMCFQENKLKGQSKRQLNSKLLPHKLNPRGTQSKTQPNSRETIFETQPINLKKTLANETQIPKIHQTNAGTSENHQKITSMFGMNIELDPTNPIFNDKFLPYIKPQSYFKVPSIPRRKVEDREITGAPDETMATVNSATFKPTKASTPREQRKPITANPEDFYPHTRSPEFKRKQTFALAGIVADKILNTEVLGDLPDPLKEIRRKINDIIYVFSQKDRVINDTLISYARQMMSEVDPFANKSIRVESCEMGPLEPQTPRPKQKLPVPIFPDDDVQEPSPHSPTRTAMLFNKELEPSDKLIWINQWVSGETRMTTRRVGEETKKLFASPNNSDDSIFDGKNEDTFMQNFSDELDDFDPFNQHETDEQFEKISFTIFSPDHDGMNSIFADEINPAVSPPDIFHKGDHNNLPRSQFKEPSKFKIDPIFMSPPDFNRQSQSKKYQLEPSNQKVDPFPTSSPENIRKSQQGVTLRSEIEASFIREFNQHNSSRKWPTYKESIDDNFSMLSQSSTVHHPFERRNIFK